MPLNQILQRQIERNQRNLRVQKLPFSNLSFDDMSYIRQVSHESYTDYILYRVNNETMSRKQWEIRWLLMHGALEGEIAQFYNISKDAIRRHIKESSRKMNDYTIEFLRKRFVRLRG